MTTADGAAQASFDVMAPKVEVPEPSTCAVALDTKYARPTLKLPVFGPGWNDVCGEKPGIKFQFKVTPQVDGSIAVIQVVDATLNNFTHLVGVDTYPEFRLPFYAFKDGPQTFHALKDKTTTWVNNDSPGEMLSGKKGEQTLVFDATDYLMFQATDGLVAIWVPLREFYWNWAATETKGPGGPNDWAPSRVRNIAFSSGPGSKEPEYSQRVPQPR